MDSHGRSARALGIAMAAIVAIQILVPAAALLMPRPARFGWQMYSTAATLPGLVAIDADGEQRVIDITTLIAGARIEVDYARLLVEQGCSVVDAAAIRVTAADGGVVEVDCR